MHKDIAAGVEQLAADGQANALGSSSYQGAFSGQFGVNKHRIEDGSVAVLKQEAEAAIKIGTKEHRHLLQAMGSGFTAKLFRHHGSQAVLLPVGFEMPGEGVKISRVTGGVWLTPILSDFEHRRATFFALAGCDPGIEDVPPHQDPDLPREF